ncbi:MAG: hypothetical protein AAFU86_00575 [Pseudomonadota bacterium]
MSLKSIWRRSEDRRLPPGTAVKRYRIAPQHPTYRFVRQQGVLVTKVSGLSDMPLFFKKTYRGMCLYGSSAPRRATALLLRDCRAVTTTSPMSPAYRAALIGFSAQLRGLLGAMT